MRVQHTHTHTLSLSLSLSLSISLSLSRIHTIRKAHVEARAPRVGGALVVENILMVQPPNYWESSYLSNSTFVTFALVPTLMSIGVNLLGFTLGLYFFRIVCGNTGRASPW